LNCYFFSQGNNTFEDDDATTGECRKHAPLGVLDEGALTHVRHAFAVWPRLETANTTLCGDWRRTPENEHSADNVSSDELDT